MGYLCKWDCFLDFSDILLSVYQNATDFYIVSLYSASLLNSFISSNSFSVMSLGFSMNSIMSSANSDSYYFSFLICIPCISFSSLIAIPKLCCWINVVKMDFLALFLILEGMCFQLFTVENGVC